METATERIERASRSNQGWISGGSYDEIRRRFAHEVRVTHRQAWRHFHAGDMQSYEFCRDAARVLSEFAQREFAIR